MNLKNKIVKLLSIKITQEFLKFGIIGTSALILEVLLISILFKIGIDLKLTRIVSIPLAILFTWYLNRTITFKSRNPKKIRQYGKYLFVILLGISINYSVYLYVLGLFKIFNYSYIIALCFGSVSSMFFNFFLSKYVIFKN